MDVFDLPMGTNRQMVSIIDALNCLLAPFTLELARDHELLHALLSEQASFLRHWRATNWTDVMLLSTIGANHMTVIGNCNCNELIWTWKESNKAR
jgi:hypothetical protein